MGFLNSLKSAKFISLFCCFSYTILYYFYSLVANSKSCGNWSLSLVATNFLIIIRKNMWLMTESPWYQQIVLGDIQHGLGILRIVNYFTFILELLLFFLPLERHVANIFLVFQQPFMGFAHISHKSLKPLTVEMNNIISDQWHLSRVGICQAVSKQPVLEVEVFRAGKMGKRNDFIKDQIVMTK